MHEHVFILDPDFLINYPELDGFDEARHVPDAIVRLNELKSGGIDTIVDLTVLGTGSEHRLWIQTVQAEEGGPPDPGGDRPLHIQRGAP